VSITNTHLQPFPKQLVSYAGEDVRFGAGAFTVYDYDTGLCFDYFLTNDRVYVGYSRTGFDRYPENNYAAFMFLIPVKMRTPEQIHKMRIVLNSQRKCVTWILDSRQVFIVSRVGYLLDRQLMVADFGGNEKSVFPRAIRYGFGAATSFDSYPACQKSDECCDCQFPTLRQGLVNPFVNEPILIYKPMNPLLGEPVPAVYYDNTSSNEFRHWGQGVESNIKSLVVFTDRKAC
jgi:hypothetical protein